MPRFEGLLPKPVTWVSPAAAAGRVASSTAPATSGSAAAANAALSMRFTPISILPFGGRGSARHNGQGPAPVANTSTATDEGTFRSMEWMYIRHKPAGERTLVWARRAWNLQPH